MHSLRLALVFFQNPQGELVFRTLYFDFIIQISSISSFSVHKFFLFRLCSGYSTALAETQTGPNLRRQNVSHAILFNAV
jgi:hypothetical protein